MLFCTTTIAVLLLLTATPSCVRGQSLDLQQDENGKNYVIGLDGVKYLVYRDSDTDGRLFFFNTITREPQWEDPRTFMPVVESMSSPLSTSTPQTAGEKLSVMAVALVPALLFIGGVAARIYYLHTYYPELLFPTKERRDRRRSSSGKLKPQKARGKMSQDGKGGRSANS